MHRTRALGALARGRGLGSQARPAAAPAARTFDDANPFHNFFDSTPGSDQPNVRPLGPWTRWCQHFLAAQI